ncbi:MAG: DNA polymerase III subunit delta [Acidimicrobiales bacterium]|nr:DNA polymerase III subunit delta [Hyphomonadaceae bacterium]RZV44690.1 MAG: DNA polymerase III subunit delta [Acidimicrobiales bacterium]
MKLTGARAENYLKSPPPDSLGALFFGPDQGLCAERATALAGQFSDNPDDPFSVTALSADDLANDPARLADEMSALSLLGDTRLIRVRLSHERPGAAVAKILKTLDARPETCAARLIIEAGDMTPRSAVRKAFETAKNFAAIPCYADTQASLATLVKNELTDLDIRIEREALDAFVPLLEGDRRLARGEIEKLALYKGYGKDEGAVVSLDDIKAIAAGAGSAGLDDIIMDAMSGNPKAADSSFRRAMDSKITPPSVLFALQRHLTRLHQAGSLMRVGQSADQAMGSLRPPVFVMQKTQFSRHLRIWSLPALSRAIAQSLEAEKQMKTAGSPAEALMGRLLMALSSYAAKRI